MRRVRVAPRVGRNRRGATLVMVAMMLVMLFAFAGLGVDLSRLYAIKAEQQTSTDAATMAAVVEVLRGRPASAPDSALAYVRRNAVEGTTATVARSEVAPGAWDVATETFTPTPGGSWTSPLPQAVQVTAHYTAAMTFARLMSGDRPVATTAVGMLGFVGTTDCLKPWAVSYRTMLDVLYPPAGSKPVSYALTATDIAHLSSDTLTNTITLLRSNQDPVAPGNIAQVVTYTGNSNNKNYKQAIAGAGCTDLPIGPGTWLDTDPGGGAGQTADALKTFCDANGGTSGKSKNAFDCLGHPRVRLAIWDDTNGATGNNLRYHVKYVGVFAVEFFDKGSGGKNNPEQLGGFFTSMAATGTFTTTPGPLRKGILVQ